MPNRVGVLTISDSAAAGEAEDRSGPLLAELVAEIWPGQKPMLGLAPDVREKIAAVLRRWADELDLALILTTGGTGFAPRDVTPEATQDVIERAAPRSGRSDAGGRHDGDAPCHALTRHRRDSWGHADHQSIG